MNVDVEPDLPRDGVAAYVVAAVRWARGILSHYSGMGTDPTIAAIRCDINRFAFDLDRHVSDKKCRPARLSDMQRFAARMGELENRITVWYESVVRHGHPC